MTEPVAETVATPEVPAAPAPIVDATTIAEHEAQLQTPPEATIDGATVERPRHRARSQRAGTDDIQQIATLTKRLREAESSFDIKREDGESDRVYRLRLRAEVAELAKQRQTETTTPPPEPEKKPATAAAPVAAPPPVPAIPSAFTEPEPKLEQFSDKDDPYAAWNRAIAAYDRRKDAFDAQQTQAKAAHEKATADAQAAQEARLKTVMESYNAKVAEFKKTGPKDFEAVVANSNPEMTPLLFEAIVTADNAPLLVYTLSAQPLLLDEVFLLTDGKPINEQSVASTQRWLTQRVQAARTGSAVASPPTPPVPRPLNPVRTGPMQTGDAPPKDGHSLREHEQAYAYKGRRR